MATTTTQYDANVSYVTLCHNNIPTVGKFLTSNYYNKIAHKVSDKMRPTRVYLSSPGEYVFWYDVNFLHSSKPYATIRQYRAIFFRWLLIY
jgi:hypothetical protein